MSKQGRALDLDLTTTDAKAASEAKLVELRNEDPVHRDRGLLVLYPIDAYSEPVNPDTRPDGAIPLASRLDASDTVVGMGLVFPGTAEKKNRVQATYVAVDLTDVETEDLDEALNRDTEVET